MTGLALNAGDDLPDLEFPRISRTTLALFAGASGDHNPMHIDIDVAKSVGLDDVFSHGMLSMAYLAQAVTNVAPQRELRTLRAKFTAITPLYAEPTCRGRVTEAMDDKATLELAVVLADGTTTLTGEAVLSPQDQ